jgi:hypothetical protein
MELFQKVSLINDLEKYGLKKGDIATLVDFVDHPDGGEKGCVLEIANALGESIDVITVPLSFVETLKADEILSVRHFSKAV